MANNMKSTIRAICSFGPELFGSEKKKSQPKLKKETRKAPIKKETAKKVAPPVPPRKKVLKLQRPQTAELKENVNDKDLLQKGQLLAAAGIFYSNVFIQFPSSFSLLFFFQLWQFYPKKKKVADLLESTSTEQNLGHNQESSHDHENVEQISQDEFEEGEEEVEAREEEDHYGEELKKTLEDGESEDLKSKRDEGAQIVSIVKEDNYNQKRNELDDLDSLLDEIENIPTEK